MLQPDVIGRHVRLRSGTGAAHGLDMDLDVIEYARWASKIRGLSPNTIRVRTQLLDRMHTYLGIALRDAEPGHLLKFERAAIAGRSPETRRAYACHLRAFYRWLIQTGAITEDPSAMLTLPIVPKHLPRPIEEDDLAIALAAARPKMRAMLVLAAFAGLRCSEIAGLDWSDLHRQADGSLYLHIRHAKGHKERTVEVGNVVHEALRAHGIRRRGPMFLGLEGRQMDGRSLSRTANTHLARHGIAATMHQLRHRYGSVAYELSRDLRMVQQQMGHASPETTAGYTRVSAEAAARMVALMDALPLRPAAQTLTPSL